MPFLTEAFCLKALLPRTHKLAFPTIRAGCLGGATWTFVLTARANETLLTFALGTSIL